MKVISDTVVEEVRSRVDIVDVVSDYVQLRRSGRTYTGLCPFHNERTPSFSVSSDKQLYYCFGCHAGGNVLRFLMDVEGMSFVDAVVKLADRINYTLPAGVVESDQSSNRDTNRYQRMKDAHELAAKYYNHILMNTTVGVQALTYLETRGFSRTTVVEFQLGFAPDKGDALVTFLKKRGFDQDLLVEAGIAVVVQHRLIDRFRSRVIIPIHDNRGSAIAFGGRSLGSASGAKYLNSPETPIFRKGFILFNQHRARKEIRATHTAVLMEGYMDVLAAWQSGVKNAVASLGTAFTAEQAGILKRLGNRIVISYDGDDAGIRAAEKAMEVTEQVGLSTRVAVLPDRMDPDEFIQARGSQAFRDYLDSRPMSSVQFRLLQCERAANLSSAPGRTEFLRQALEILAQYATPIEQETEISRLSSEHHVTVDTLKEELLLVAKKSGGRRKNQEEPSRPTAVPAAKALPKGYIEAGNLLLQAILTDPGNCELAMSHGVDDLALPEQTALLALLYGFRASHPEGDAHAFINTLDDPELVGFASSLLMRDQMTFNAALLEDYLRSIKKYELRSALQGAFVKLAEAQLQGDEAGLVTWKARVSELQRDIERVEKSP